MKHVKYFENYTTSTSNVDFVYNKDENEIEYSEIVNDTINYINENYNNIVLVDIDNDSRQSIEFEKIDLKKIIIHWNNNISMLQFKFEKILPEYQNYSINEEEFRYLEKFFLDTKIKKNRDYEKKNLNATEILNPIKRASNKYNL